MAFSKHASPPDLAVCISAGCDPHRSLRSYGEEPPSAILYQRYGEGHGDISTADGSRWKVVRTEAAERKSKGSPFLFGGPGTDVVLHGEVGMENPLMPKMRADSSMWGPAKVYKIHKLVKSNALVHVMISSRDRTKPNFHYSGCNMTRGPVDEIHLFRNPHNRLPAPSGFLLVMLEGATVKTETNEPWDS